MASDLSKRLSHLSPYTKISFITNYQNPIYRKLKCGVRLWWCLPLDYRYWIFFDVRDKRQRKPPSISTKRKILFSVLHTATTRHPKWKKRSWSSPILPEHHSSTFLRSEEGLPYTHRRVQNKYLHKNFTKNRVIKALSNSRSWRLGSCWFYSEVAIFLSNCLLIT